MKIHMRKSDITIPMKLGRDKKNVQVSTSQNQSLSISTPTTKLYSGMFRNIQNTKSCGSCGK